MKFLLIGTFCFLFTSCNPFVENSFLNFFNKNSIAIDDKGSTEFLSETKVIEWKPSLEVEQEAMSYEVSIGSQSQSNNVVDWINVGLAKSYKFNVALNPNTKYYVNLRYIDLTGNTSEVFSSSGFITPPEAPFKISAGRFVTCSLNLSGKVKCWGNNSYGQLGYDDTMSRGDNPGEMASLSYVDLGPGRTAKNIYAGWFHVCAILDNDQVKCWGQNSYGQLGYDDNLQKGDNAGEMASLGYVNLGPGRTAKKISIGYQHTCAVLDNNLIKCWGRNNTGQLGYDDVTTRGDDPGEMASLGYVDLGLGRTAKDLSLGSVHSCALLDNNQVKCWGHSSYGKLGYDDGVQKGDNPGEMASLGYVDLGLGRTAKSIHLGTHFTCVHLDNDQVKCWGQNNYGQSGYDDNLNRGDNPGEMASLSYVDLGPGRTVKKISLGGYHACALLDNNQIKCWGLGGQLGTDDGNNRGDDLGEMASLGYVNLGLNRTAKDIELGEYSSCAILDNNKIKCWGNNTYGELGYDDVSARGGTGLSITSDPHNLYTP